MLISLRQRLAHVLTLNFYAMEMENVIIAWRCTGVGCAIAAFRAPEKEKIWLISAEHRPDKRRSATVFAKRAMFSAAAELRGNGRDNRLSGGDDSQSLAQHAKDSRGGLLPDVALGIRLSSRRATKCKAGRTKSEQQNKNDND